MQFWQLYWKLNSLRDESAKRWLFEDYVSLMQAGQVDVLSCKVNLKSPAEVSIEGSRPGLPARLTAHAKHMSPAAVRMQDVSTKEDYRSLAELLGHEMLSHGPVARVHVGDKRNVGYCCHPALTDSSMHIGILAGTADGKIRIPSMLLSYLKPFIALGL